MRVKTGYTSRRRHKRVMKQAKGFRGRRNNCYKLAKDAVEHGLQYAYRDRRNRKRDFRQLWIIRINAAARQVGLSYSQLMGGLRRANVELDRKALAELAVTDPAAFQKLAEQARAAVQ